MTNWSSYLFVAMTVLLTVYGQIVIKWQVLEAGALPADVSGKARFVVDLLLNLWVLSGLAAALVASVTWMLAMSKLPLSHAYPFVSLSFVLVLFLSYAVFSEPLTLLKILGVGLIVIGVAVSSQG